MKKKLTAKQEAFIQAYIETNNATESARRAGYSAKTAGVIGEENLKKPYISAEIGKRKAKIAERHERTIDKLMDGREQYIESCKKEDDRTNLKEGYKEVGKLIGAYQRDNEQRKTKIDNNIDVGGLDEKTIDVILNNYFNV